MASYEQIVYDVSDQVATITLNRPEKLNAWTMQMDQEVTAAMQAASEDANVRAIVLTGAGKGFCAGADMSMLSALASEGLTRAGMTSAVSNVPESVPAELRVKYAWILSIPKPIICAINGAAVGLGFVIPLYCDFRFASESAKFSVIFSKRGLIAEYGLAWMLPRLIGPAAAIDLILSSRMVNAQDALKLGLVNRVCADMSLAGEARAFAMDLAANVSPRSIGVMKRQIYSGLNQTFPQAFEMAIEEMKLSLQSSDFKEGVSHFLEKRAAAFTGR